MSRCDRTPEKGSREAVFGQGTGDGLFPISLSQDLKSEEGKNGRDIIGSNRETRFRPSPVPSPIAADLDDFEAYIARQVRGREGDERDDLEAYLRTYPGRSVADWKGKALSAPVDALPWEKPWHKLNPAEVRDAATRSLARDLPLNIRKAAGRDPGLIWNDYARKYRARLASDPAHEMGGGHES